MLFNSIEFAIFLPLFFSLYWFAFKRSIKQQNIIIVIGSFIFYGWWDWRFLFLLLFSASVDYFVSLKIVKSENSQKRKYLLYTSILTNLGLLGFFKYYNFFVESFVDAFSLFGQNMEGSRLNIILPVGISFYTFQALSYSIDVYRGKLKPTNDIIAYFAFISFFPQLVAGPIERATNLLPQFFKKRVFDVSKATDGMRQILWGLFKKIVIADNCAFYANNIFDNYNNHTGSTLFLGAILFTFQIYGDFSGYSDIAIGTSRLFGFSLMRNFAYPYFSRDIAEFWRRWHISLSTWFRDYVYIPLGGSQHGKWIGFRNTILVFLISGFWHGANWTFLMWGLINALYFLPLLLTGRNRLNLDTPAVGKTFASGRDILHIILTFCLTSLAWIFFRSPTVSDAFQYVRKIVSASLFSVPSIDKKLLLIIPFIFILIGVEWIQRHKQHGLEFENNQLSPPMKILLYYLVVLSILFFGGTQQDFIYFQF